jgi:hypothetical protein
MTKTIFNTLFIIVLITISTGCTHGFNIKNIDYVKPERCEIEKENFEKFKTYIKDNNLIIDNENLSILLKNMHKQKQLNEDLIECLYENNEYLENIIKVVLDKKD